jgi:hypothetical protein
MAAFGPAQPPALTPDLRTEQFMTLTLTTYDWVPDLPRGYVRDLRIRWALEEAEMPYRVASTPFR